jgi:hypothetical protein
MLPDSRITGATVVRGAPALAAGSSPKSQYRLSEIAVREIVIVALACFVIGLMAAALVVQFVP